MSKASRNRSKEKRLKEKMSRKRAKKALYESYAKAGANKKSKRFKNKAVKKLSNGVSHPDGENCGNPACKRCYGVYYGGFLRKGQPYRMPQWMYQRWCKAK